MGEAIALAILGVVLTVIGLRALLRGKIHLGLKNEQLSKLLLLTPPTTRTGRWARVLGALLTLLGVFFLFAAARAAFPR